MAALLLALSRVRERVAGGRERASMTDSRLLMHAKALRKNMTDAEQKLWYHLRGHRFGGAKFKRQKPIGPFIVDFVCLEGRLVIELDGGQHADAHTYDERRDAWLAANGYRVLRFWNNEVMQELPGVLERIWESLLLGDTPSPPAPLPHAGEGSKSSVATSLSPLPHAGERSKSSAAASLSPLSHTGEGSKSSVATSLSPLPHAGERSKSSAATSLSPLSHTGEGSKGAVAGGRSPLPRAGEGGRRPGEGVYTKTTTAPEEVRGHFANRRGPDPCDK